MVIYYINIHKISKYEQLQTRSNHLSNILIIVCFFHHWTPVRHFTILKLDTAFTVNNPVFFTEYCTAFVQIFTE